MDMTSTARTRKCTYRRCNQGTVRTVSGMDVTCQKCGGSGRIASVEDMRRADAAGQRRWSLIKTLNVRAEQLGGRDALDEVRAGRDHLETHAPERHARLLDALEAGRVDAVIAHLRPYAREHAYR